MRKNFNAGNAREICLMFAVDPLPLGNIAGEQDGDCMKPRTCQFAYPSIGWFRPVSPSILRTRDHALTEFLGKCRERSLISLRARQGRPR